MSKVITRAFLAVFLILGCTAFAAASDAFMGKPAPDFKAKDVDGNAFTLADLKGKVVWINFWGLRCGPCVRELPALQSIYSRYAEKGLVILGVNADGVDAAFIKKSFAERDDLKKLNLTFKLVPDMEFALIDSYQLMGAPLNVMVDREGVVQFYHEGYEEGDEKGYEETVKKLLGN